MKSKPFGKKLTLNKRTVADLNQKQLSRIIAGAEETAPCFTRDHTCDMCMSDEPQCTVEATCLIACTFLYSKNTRPC